jgi:hypothetical protein
MASKNTLGEEFSADGVALYSSSSLSISANCNFLSESECAAHLR